MKYLVVLIVLFTCHGVYSQKITGFVMDKTTKQPVSGALVTLGSSHILTNISGAFEITIPAVSDSLKITHFTYKPYFSAFGKSSNALRIELEPKVTKLNEVTVHGTRDFKQDSIENRNAYARQFNYTGPKVTDAFMSNTDKQPGDIISINPLLLIAALTKKSSPEYKFKQMLIRDEQATYIDTKFNRGIVSHVISLKEDTLSEFLTRYRPTYEFAMKATEYDMEIYIKESFRKFKEEGNVAGSDPFHNSSSQIGDAVKLN